MNSLGSVVIPVLLLVDQDQGMRSSLSPATMACPIERRGHNGEGPMLHHVTLHLARSKEFPEGSSRCGYDITAPLDAEGHLDQDEWAAKRVHCRVRRFRANEGEHQGVLVHRPGGTG